MNLIRSTCTAVLLAFAVVILSSGPTASAREDRAVDSVKEPKSDKEFLAWAIACEVAEVKFAEHAQKNAKSEEVRKLAGQIAEKHRKVRDNLLEKAKEWKMAVVEGLEKNHRERWNRLTKLEGEEYDREYLSYLAEGHQIAEKMYEKWAKETKEEKIREAVDDNVKAIKDHQKRIKELRKTDK